MDLEPKSLSEIYMEYMVEYQKMVDAAIRQHFAQIINNLHDKDFWESING